MPVVLHVAADDSAVKDVKGGEQGGRAVAFIVVCHRAGATRLHRQPWLGAVEGFDLALLVYRENDGVGGRVDIKADHFSELLGELRVVQQLERPDAVRRELVGLEDAVHRPQADTRRLRQHPAGPVRGFSGGPVTRSTTNCTVPAGSGGLPGLRVLSRSNPSTPSAMNRACQVHTTGFALADRRMISAVPQPSAVARMIWARHTCFCGAQRSETIASSRRRSARVTLTTIPALMTRA